MVDQGALLKDLQAQVRLLEEDLRERSEDPDAVKGIDPQGEDESFDAYLEREYQRARREERTAITEGEWRQGQITQAAVAWVLSTVFVRFCEDNGLLEQPFIAGPKDERDRYGIAQEMKEAWVLQGRQDEPDAPERTDRDWLEYAFEQMSVSPIMAGLFDRGHSPMWTVTPSHQAAKRLIEFWRTVGDDGHLVHDFTDSEWNTRFLGDLYQNLSEVTRKTYALLQTPDFVEEFILDYTLEPAIEEFGLDGKRLYQADDESDKEGKKGFRLIDPTCGSGHFLLGAFNRLLGKWRETEAGASDWDLISRSLKSVHGVDKNPYAVAIARFRLLMAAMREGGITTLKASNPEWPIVVATGDSLIHGRDVPGARDFLSSSGEEHRYDTEDYYRYASKYDLLGAQSYHAVVGNPPYITVKDKQEKLNYKDRYPSSSGAYALSVPFAERFFNLARRAGANEVGPGFVGQITANSFMKREFGKKLIEVFFRNRVRLTHVLDSSGAYIPGHGTPTVILVGRNTPNSHKAMVRVLLGVRGEPSQPSVASEGLVWRALVDQVEAPGSESEWISSVDLPWDSLKDHPWSLSGGGAGQLFSILGGKRELGDVVSLVGRSAHTGSDEAYFAPRGAWNRFSVGGDRVKPIVEGDAIRDWVIDYQTESIFPYDSNLKASLEDISSARILWRCRQGLRSRQELGGSHEEVGLTWYEWSRWHPERFRVDLGIGMASVATHNHFVLDRGGKVFKQTAPVIKLPEGAAEDQYLGLLGLLNSSVACFWLKQVCQGKGNRGGERSTGRWEWEKYFDFTGNKVKKFPISESLPLSRSKELDSLTRRLSSHEPSAVVKVEAPTVERLKEARSEYENIRQRMVALQEELDWDVYHRYGLVTDDQLAELILPDTAEVPAINLGERAFEVALARRMGTDTDEAFIEWFNRHGSTPITELPDHWPDAYKRVVAKRIEFIESNKNLNLLERPEYKRRWESEPWDKKQKTALKSWLLDKCEDRRLWFAPDGYGVERACPLTTRTLANRVRDLFPEVAEVAALYHSGREFGEVIAEIVKTEHVPYLAALRYKDSGMRKHADWEHVWDLQREEDRLNADLSEGEEERRLDIPVPPKYKPADFHRSEYWSNRGKLDVPKERFVSYPGAETDTDPTLLLGWAGWDHAQQADALGSLAHERHDELGWGKDEDTRDRMIPLLAGLRELLPWVEQWHTETDDYGDTPADHVREDLTELRDATGITESQMTEWRPSAPKRGRSKKA